MTSTPTWCLENRGSFASIHVILPPRTQVHCETDAVVTFSGGVEVQGALSGGLWGSIFRMFLGGESFFTTKVENTSHEQPGDVMMAAADPGGIELHQLTPQSDLLLTPGAYVASDTTVTITTELQAGIKNSLLSGTGFFLLRASGRGTVACAAYGSIHKFELKAGEIRAVDNGHLVAWTANTHYRVGLANARGGFMTSVKSGEGLMCHFTGPGTIYLQSHKPGEAETVVKHGKNTAKTGASIAVLYTFCIFVFFMIFVVAAVVLISFQTGNFTVNTNSYEHRYDDSGYSGNSYRSTGSNGRARQGYRSLEEF